MLKIRILLSILFGIGLFTTFSSQAASYPFGIYEAKNKECKTNTGKQGDDLLFVNLCLPSKELTNMKALEYLTKYMDSIDTEGDNYQDIVYYKLPFKNYNQGNKQIIFNNTKITIVDPNNIFNPRAGNNIVLFNDVGEWKLCYNSKVYSIAQNYEALIPILKNDPIEAKLTAVLALPECSSTIR